MLGVEALYNIRAMVSSDLTAVEKLINDAFLNSKHDISTDIGQHVFSAGGKRIRAILTLLISKIFDYKGTNHIKAAAIVEVIHNATLLHDDVVDESSHRRGNITANCKWDNKSCILVGDLMFAVAFKWAAEIANNDISTALAKSNCVIVEGEIQQMLEISNIDMETPAYIEIISAKTAELFSISCEVGAILSNISKERRLLISRFGYNLGMAFQIIDDLMDYFSDASVMGKPLGNDFKNANVTLPIIVLQDCLTAVDRGIIRDHFLSGGGGNLKFSEVLNMMKQHGVYDKIIIQAEHYIDLAKDNLNHSSPLYGQKELNDLLNFIISRKF